MKELYVILLVETTKENKRTMKVFMNSIKVMCLVLILLCKTNCLYAENNSAPAKVLWQRDFRGGNNLSYSPGAVTFNKANNRLLILGTSFRQKTYSEGKFWLWEVDQKGEIIRNIVLKNAPEEFKSVITLGFILITDIAASRNGDIFAVGKFDDFKQSFMKIDREGRIIFSKTISERGLKESLMIDKMIHLIDDSFLLVGWDGTGVSDSNGVVIKIDSEGNRLWKKTYDLGRADSFTDGVSVGSKGEFLVIGCSTELKRFFPVVPSDIYVLRCDAKGTVLSEEFSPGDSSPTAQPKVCQLDSGDFVVAYDKRVGMGTTDLRIKAFSPDLKKVLWEKEVFKLEKAAFPTPFNIMAVPGGFIVSDSVGVGIFKVYEYDNEGNQLNSLSVDKAGWLGNIHLAHTGDKAFVISGTLPKSKDNRISNIKVIATELKLKKRSKKIPD